MKSSLRPITMFVLAVAALLLVSPPGSLAAAQTLFVTPGGAGSACTQSQPCSLPTALAQAADGDTLYLAQGSYTGGGGAVLILTKSLSVYGGWDGTTQVPPRRSPTQFPTTLDGEGKRRVVDISGGASPTIDGFTITGGLGDFSGGGIRSESASPIIRYNRIVENHANGDGGAIFVNGGSAQILYNLIQDNTGSWSAGLRLINDTQVSVIGNLILDNQATVYFGGGVDVSCCGNATALVARNLISGNDGGQIGGGILVSSAKASLVNNLLVQNRADKGAGIWLEGMDSYPSQVDLFNNTLIGGAAGGEAVWVDQYVTVNLVNNILAGHTLSILDASPATNTLTVDHNLFWDNGSDPILGTHAVKADPVLDAFYHLRSGSPAINAGAPVGLNEDIDGDPRPLGAFDLGADEYALKVYLPLGMNGSP